MRNIAARLGVGTMTLYTWVQNKDDLVDAMSDALSARLLVPEPLPADWRAALHAIALAARDTVEAHPWMFRGGRRGRIGANLLRHIDQSLRAVSGIELDWQMRAAVLQAIDNYAISHALASIRRRGIRDAARRDRDVAEPERSGRGPRAETPRGDEATDLEMRVLFDSGELEYLAARFGTLQEALGRIEQGPPEIDGAFELGLGWLLDGIEAMIARQGGTV